MKPTIKISGPISVPQKLMAKIALEGIAADHDLDLTEHASQDLFSFISENADEMDLQRMSLHVFGMSWKFNDLKKLKINVAGYCPECGERLEQDFYETLPQTHDHEREGIEFDYCSHCRFNNYSELI